MLKHGPSECWEILTRKQASAGAHRQSFHKATSLRPLFPLETARSLLWPVVSPSKGLIICTVQRKPMSDPSPPNHRFSSISAAAEPCGGRQYPNCFPSNNLSRTTAANLKPRFSDRSFGRWGALCRDPWTVGICFLKLLWDGCHLWKRFLMSKAKI